MGRQEQRTIFGTCLKGLEDSGIISHPLLTRKLVIRFRLRFLVNRFIVRIYQLDNQEVQIFQITSISDIISDGDSYPILNQGSTLFIYLTVLSALTTSVLPFYTFLSPLICSRTVISLCLAIFNQRAYSVYSCADCTSKCVSACEYYYGQSIIVNSLFF